MSFEIREAKPEDAETIVELVVELCAFEGKTRDQVELTKEIVLRDGFGESPSSLVTGAYVRTEPTPFHTAIALLLLIKAGRVHTPLAQRSAQWLLEHQEEDGSWQNKDFFAAGIPAVWYTNFSFTPTYYAAKSLNRYLDATKDRGLL